MSLQARGFLMRNDVAFDDVASIVREDGRTVVQTVDGRSLPTFISLKYFVEEFPAGALSVVNKGVALACSQVVEQRGRTYVMADGRTFEGRARGSADAKAKALARYAAAASVASAAVPAASVVPGAEAGARADAPAARENGEGALGEGPSSESAAVCAEADRRSLRELTHGPAFCSLQLVFEEGSASLIVRYCSPRLASLLGVHVGDVQDGSLYAKASGADRRWFPAFADVAINGGERTIEVSEAQERGFSSILCFQPRKGYCDCVFAC